jgi:sugar/nucleoside kinase (ribokinase family)
MKSSPSVEVLVAGLNVVDLLARLPEKIQRGEKHELRDLAVQGGAPAGNAACVIAALGWRTGFLARLGGNTLAQIARAEFTRHGVVEDFFIADAEAVPGVALVEIDPRTAERTVFYTLNGYHYLTRADVPVETVRRAKLILADGYETAAALAMLEAAQGTPCRSVIDVEAGEPETLRKLMELATDAILPLGAAKKLSGEKDAAAALKKLQTWTRAQLLVTDGGNGSWALTPQKILHQPAFKVNAVDTTGCGDAYHGAYAAALLDGLALPRRMEFAAWVAAQVALKLGGRANLPTRESLRRADLSPLSAALRKHLQA